MIPIIVNGKTHNIDTDEPCTIKYNDICKLAGCDIITLPTVTCRSPGRTSHTLCIGMIGPVELGVIYNVVNTINA